MCTASIIRVMMEAVLTSERPVYFNKTTLRFISEGFHLHTRHCENLESDLFKVRIFKSY
jgi:hypothetical protein